MILNDVIMNLMLRPVESQCVSLFNILDGCYLIKLSRAPTCIHAAHTVWLYAIILLQLVIERGPLSAPSSWLLILAPIALHEELVEKQEKRVQFET